MFEHDFPREEYGNRIAGALRVLRAATRISQDEVAYAVGITRQTYASYENGSRELPWDKCLALLFYFEHNEEANKMIEMMGLLK